MPVSKEKMQRLRAYVAALNALAAECGVAKARSLTDAGGAHLR